MVLYNNYFGFVYGIIWDDIPLRLSYFSLSFDILIP